MNINELYKIYQKHPNIVTDTRKIIPNSIFFALKGTNFNGNHFAEKALEQGAQYAVVDEIKENFKSNPKIVQTRNVLETLQKLANYHRQQLDIPIIGITGTNGKTTTKELLNAVLSSQYETLATQGNFNNHIGVPLTLLSIRKEHEIAIVEMGANHPGEIADLCKIAEPNIGLVTNVGLAHLEGFLSFENIISTKSALYQWVSKKGGTNFLLSENKEIKAYLPSNTFVEYSIEDASRKYYGKSIHTEGYLIFKLSKVNGNPVDINISTQLMGNYNASNVLAAITLGAFFNIETNKIAKAIENYQPSNNRSQIKETERNTLILDAYNANPSSVKEAVQNFNQAKSKDKTIILGDMFELGNFDQEKHQEIVDMLSSLKFSNVILIGEAYYATKNHSFKSFKSISDEALISFVKTLKHHTILLKGSRGMSLENLVEYL